MSRGVAVTFKDMFGRPSSSDYINSHLTLQKNANGVSVYSLITKPKFFMKPRTSEYDLAFDQLTEDFRKRGFKKLVCSPMGCVRDKIKTYHFASKVSEFQRVTGALVEIVSDNQAYEEQILRNRLSHEDFQDDLINKISNQDLQPETLNTATPCASNICAKENTGNNNNDDTTNSQDASSINPTSRLLQQDPLVAPGVLTYSEVLKSGGSDCVESVAAGSGNSSPNLVQSPASPLNSTTLQNTTIK